MLQLECPKLSSMNTCDSCFSPEDIHHIFWDCPKSSKFWDDLGFKPTPFLPATEPHSWFHFNSTATGMSNNIPSYLLFLFGCHCLWKGCNQRQPGATSFSPAFCRHLALEYLALGTTHKPDHTKQGKLIMWEPPPPSHFKLNTDGAVKNSTGVSGVGGLIRDSKGTFIKGFAKNIGISNCLTVEFTALREGLLMADRFGLTPLHVEIDSASVISMLDVFPQHHPLISLIFDCRCLLRKLSVEDVHHVYREGNEAADALAGVGCTLFPMSSVYFDVPPTGVDLAISKDNDRVGSIRICKNS